MLAPWKKSYDQPRQHIKKQRHYFANKGPSVKAMVFPVVMWMWELNHKQSWALRNWCFWNMVLEKTLESPLDYKAIKTVNPKEINPEYSLEGLMWSWSSNTLATWCKKLTHWKRPWCWERLKAGEEGWQRMRWLDGITNLMDMTLSKLPQRVRHDLATELNWNVIPQKGDRTPPIFWQHLISYFCHWLFPPTLGFILLYISVSTLCWTCCFFFFILKRWNCPNSQK